VNKSTYIGQQLYIRPTYIVSIPEYHNTEPFQRSSKQISNQDNLKKNSHHGNISAKAKQKIKNAINWLLVSAKKKRVYSKLSKKHFYFKVNFITLTLPASYKEVTEAQFKTLLHSWIQRCRYKYALKNYVWRVERQANGRLHVHLTSDCWIHYKDVARTWNEILFKNGVLKQWCAEHGNNNPPSTEVHAVRNVKNLGAYLAKYLTKQSDKKFSILGKTWGTNYELSAKNGLNIGLNPNEMSNMKCLMSKSIKCKEIRAKSNWDWIEGRLIGEVYYLNENDWLKNMNGQIKEAYDNKRFHIRHNIQEVEQVYEV